MENLRRVTSTERRDTRANPQGTQEQNRDNSCALWQGSAMKWDTFHILVMVAGAFSIAALIKPTWVFAGIAILLICIALFTKGQ